MCVEPALHIAQSGQRAPQLVIDIAACGVTLHTDPASEARVPEHAQNGEIIKLAGIQRLDGGGQPMP